MNPRIRGFKVHNERTLFMGRRDSRADMLKDDPFGAPQLSQNGHIHRVHQRTDAKGTVHIDAASGGMNPIFAQLFGTSSWGAAQQHTGKLWHFSAEEKQHLAQAMGAFTLALGFLSVGGMWGLNELGTSGWIITLLISMPVMFIAIGPAFLFHEIGHKLVAKRNGCWAEFRADPRGLRMGVLMSFFLGFLFMAPGAVMVAGLVTRRQNGHIAIAGPLTNLGLFLIGIPLWGIIIGLTGAFDAGVVSSGTMSLNGSSYFDEGSLVWQAVIVNAGIMWLGANLFLGLFNMIPWGPLDGLKVRDWNESAFLATIGIFAILLFTLFTGAWSLTGALHLIADPVSTLIR